MILRRRTLMQRGRRQAVICLEGLCGILRKWLFSFVQCSCDCMGDGDEELQILSSVEDLWYLGRNVSHLHYA